jgi:hypothetical protein
MIGRVELKFANERADENASTVVNRKYITYNNYYIRWLAIAVRSAGVQGGFEEKSARQIRFLSCMDSPRVSVGSRAMLPVVGMAFIVNGQLFRGGLVFGRKNTFGTTSSLAGSPSGPPEAEEGRRGGSLVCRARLQQHWSIPWHIILIYIIVILIYLLI